MALVIPKVGNEIKWRQEALREVVVSFGWVKAQVGIFGNEPAELQRRHRSQKGDSNKGEPQRERWKAPGWEES